jgi:ribonuclease P/MRP protein subunit POP1
MRKLAQLEKRQIEEHDEALEGTTLPAFKETGGSRFCRRQRNKTWLPSHLWTCKRAHMETRWGYALPISPNEKMYRATHRASKSKGVMVFDTSYMGSILLQGRAKQLASLLDRLTKSQEACGKRAMNGALVFNAQAHLHELLCPISVLWDGASTEAAAHVSLRIHPAGFSDVWQTVLQLRSELRISQVKVIDTRFLIGSIELVGPAAINTLLSILKSTSNDTHSQLFKSLHGLLPKEVPDNVVVPLTVQDSRRIFPPRLVTEPAKAHNKHLTQWPNQAPGSQLFDLGQLEYQNRSRHSQSDIDQGLIKLGADDIPVILSRTRLGFCLQAPWATITDFWYQLNHIQHVRFGGLQEYRQVHYEAGLPHFPTDFPGTRAGQSEAKHKRDELEVAYLRRPPAKRPNWEKSVDGRPEVGDPFDCDWHYLLKQHSDGKRTMKQSIADDQSNIEVSRIDATLEPLSHPTACGVGSIDTVMHDVANSPVGQDVSMRMENSIILPASITAQHTQVEDSFERSPLTARAVQGILRTHEPNLLVPVLFSVRDMEQLLNDGRTHSRAIVQVKITLLGRGCPCARARIYASVSPDGSPNGPQEPGKLLGYLTTGNFDLGQGKATGLGCLLLEYIMDVYEKRQARAQSVQHIKQARIKPSAKSARKVEGRCFVRDVGTGNYRGASWTLIE